MKRQRLAGILALATAASVLGACGSSNTNTAAADSAAAATETAAVETATGTTESADSESAATTESAADTEVTTIVAATGATPRPYIFYDDNNNLTGYDYDVLVEIFDRLPQYELQFEATDFASIFSGMNSGIYQIGVNSFTYNEERASSYLYSYPYDLNSYVIVQRADAEPIGSFADLAGKTTEDGASNAISTGIEKWNADHPDQTISLSYTELDTTALLQRVSDGAIDFLIIDPAMFEVYTEDFGFEDLQATDLDEESKAFISNNLNAYLLFPQDESALRDEINVIIKELHDDGTLAELTQKWFGRELVPADDQYLETIN